MASFMLKETIMPMAQKTDADKVNKLREMAKDTKLPQAVRNQYLDDAVKLEEKAAMRAGVKMAKGGAVKAAPKKTAMAKGGAVAKKGKK